MKRIVFLSLMSIFFMLHYATNAQEKTGRKTLKKEFKEETFAYYEQKILPLAQTQRQKLEYLLANDDKKIIAEARLFFSERTSEKIEQNKEKYKEFRLKLKEIAKKNKGTIDEAFLPIKTQRETWKNDLKSIKNKYIPDQDNYHHHRTHFKNKKLAFLLMEESTRRNVSFLLFNHIATPTKVSQTQTTSALKSINVYPNSISTNNTLSFELQKESIVNVELLNEKSEIIRNLVNNQSLNGSQKLDFDLSNLKQGVYFYRITIDKQQTIKKLLKN